SEDPATAHRAAHTLTGLADTFGATTLARLCREADPAAVAAEHARVVAALEQVSGHLADV
uniref:Hpt domain-containing protein n=1 Tax=Pseudonocardia pini TaxID=2758030 RepID=UPI0015F0DE79